MSRHPGLCQPAGDIHNNTSIIQVVQRFSCKKVNTLEFGYQRNYHSR